MLFFPQLSTGAIAQYPIKKRRITRSIVNACLDGSAIKVADVGGSATEWQLQLTDLDDAELQAIQQFFSDIEGRLNTFTFLDPTDNLFTWSETLEKNVWQKNALLRLESGVADPHGSTRATRIANTAASELSIQQDVNVPAWFRYCFSVYARSETRGSVTQTRATDSILHELTPEWRRILFSGQSTSNQETVAFGLRLSAGTSIEVFGLQVEPQPGASEYKATFSTGGVYPFARLNDDTLAITSHALNRHACTLHIVARRTN